MTFTGRTLAAALFGAFVGAWVGRALFVWILDVGRTWELAGVIGVALAGAAVCALGDAAEREPG